MPNISLSTLRIDALPSAEDDVFEYKSSKTPISTLKEKLNRAASAFCNSGGGCFLAGIAGDGTPDGGLEPTVGRQSLRDWADQVIALTSPPVKYDVRLFDDNAGKGRLDSGKVILGVSFFESHSAPHMAEDKKYYIRAGAHSRAAAHFIVEALWARRALSKPQLSHAVRLKPGDSDVIQLGIVALTPAPAIDVEFQIEPLAGLLQSFGKYFPLRLPVVDQNTPFFLDATNFHRFDEEFPDSVVVSLKYRDVAGNEYDYRSARPFKEAIAPLTIGTDPTDKIGRAIAESAGHIVRAIEKLAK